MPSLPSFMIMAGVTGIMCSGAGVGAGVGSFEPIPCIMSVDACGCGAAGGGIDKSTGEGVSPGISFGDGTPRPEPPCPDLPDPDAIPEPTAGKSGVEFADFMPPRRLCLRVLHIEGIVGGVPFCMPESRLTWA